MASYEAYSALIGDAAEWNAYRTSHPGIIDLKLANLKNRKNLAGKDLSFCDFSGADFENSDLDHCTIHNSLFISSFLANASLVSSKIMSSTFKGANMQGTVFREAELRDAYFINTNLKGTTVTNCHIDKCTFSDSDIHSMVLMSSTLNDCKFSKMTIKKAQLSGCEFNNSVLVSSVWRDSVLKSLRFKNCAIIENSTVSSELDDVHLLTCSITRLHIEGTIVSQMNLSGSTLVELDLSKIDLPNTVLLDVAVSNCKWPEQKGRTTLSGKYIKSQFLMGHPVQDVKGLSPSLRRVIADAQYLEEVLSNSSTTSKVLLQVWGASTNYGQSLLRLTTLSMILISALSIAFVVSDGHISSWPGNLDDGLNAIGFILLSFFGFGTSGNIKFLPAQELVLLIARVFGFFILGLWIGIAANKLGKLSSE